MRCSRVFLTLPTEISGKVEPIKNFQWEKFSYMYKEDFPKISDYSDEKYGIYGLLEKKCWWSRLASSIEHVLECKNDKERRCK